MDDNIIDFNEAKEQLIEKNYDELDGEAVQRFLKENDKIHRSFLSFYKKLDALALYLYMKERGTECKIETVDEVLKAYNKYFDVVYKHFGNFNADKVPVFKEACDYAMLAAGKRLRPFLMFVTYYFFGGEDFGFLNAFMVAIEMVHTFSLIHDDLPCIDNDELRRGKPTVWKKYGEDIAVLTGDALLMHSNVILLQTIVENLATEFEPYAIGATYTLMKMSGISGMLTGEVFDVVNTKNKQLTKDDLEYMYKMKTGALIVAAMEMGAHLAMIKFDTITDVEKLAIDIGFAYQIQDDLLEVESTAEMIGKATNSDSKNGKVTYVSKYGIEKSKRQLEKLKKDIYNLIDKLSVESDEKNTLVFKEVIKYILERKK